MNQVYELCYEQHISLAGRDETTTITAGYTRLESTKNAWLAAHGTNTANPVTLDDDDMWMCD